MTKWLRLLLDILLPPRCLLCGKEIHSDNSLCSDCFTKIDFISRPYCKKCGRPFPETVNGSYYCAECLSKRMPFRLCRAAVEYNDHSKKLILDFKFFDHVQNKMLLARWLYMAGKDIFNAGVDLIIPVPLHYTRMFKRKYNQSAVLSAGLSKLCGIPVDYKSLKKTRHTLPQVHCSGKQRLKNVRNAFEVAHPENIKGKRIVLIDDVFTTGSTLKECAKVLKKAGAKSVDALTVARVCR